ncbi:MAG TPA: type II toxin-antitoxin system VapC family toxin, partial [Allocoleopsis sp.]
LWEMSIKISLGKLEMGITLTELVQRDVYGNAIDLLAIKIEHLEQLAKLPFHHKDPFDRLIIAQSLAENIPIITKDSLFQNYLTRIIW